MCISALPISYTGKVHGFLLPITYPIFPNLDDQMLSMRFLCRSICLGRVLNVKQKAMVPSKPEYRGAGLGAPTSMNQMNSRRNCLPRMATEKVPKRPTFQEVPHIAKCLLNHLWRRHRRNVPSSRWILPNYRLHQGKQQQARHRPNGLRCGHL